MRIFNSFSCILTATFAYDVTSSLVHERVTFLLLCHLLKEGLEVALVKMYSATTVK